MLFLIRETLIINWGKGNISVLKKDGKKDANEKSVAQIELVKCRDFINCEYCNAENERRKKLMNDSKKNN